MKTVFASVPLVVCLGVGVGGCVAADVDLDSDAVHQIQRVSFEGSLGDIKEIHTGDRVETTVEHPYSVSTLVALGDDSSDANGMLSVRLRGDFSSVIMGQTNSYAEDVFVDVVGYSNSEEKVRACLGFRSAATFQDQLFEWDAKADHVAYTVNPGEADDELVIDFVAHFAGSPGKTEGTVVVTVNSAIQNQIL